MKQTLFFLLWLLSGTLSLTAYTPNPQVPPAIWQSMVPYFLPEDHPIKPALDKIFAHPEVTHTSESLREAGFKNPYFAQPMRPVVSKHPELKGYLVKLFTDGQPVDTMGREWKRRIEGARYIREAIIAHDYEDYFRVPRKWIYPLPVDPATPAGMARKHFILVVEDMYLMKEQENLDTWKGLEPRYLDAIYTLLQEQGLIDMVYPENLPFTRDYRLAFIETQHFHQWPVHFNRLTRHLSKTSQTYWIELIEQGGPVN